MKTFQKKFAAKSNAERAWQTTVKVDSKKEIKIWWYEIRDLAPMIEMFISRFYRW